MLDSGTEGPGQVHIAAATLSGNSLRQWCIAKNGGGYTQRGVVKGLKIPCLFMITEVNIRSQKNPEVGVPAYTPQYTTGLRQTVHTHHASVHQTPKLAATLLRVAGVTASLAESNGSLPPGL